MISACTSIKVAVLLNKVANLPKEHFRPLDPILYFQLLFLRLPCCCDRDLVTSAGTGRWRPNRDAIGLHGCRCPKREYRGDPEKKNKKCEYGFFQGGEDFYSRV